MKEENIIIQGAIGKLKGIITTPIHCKEKETPTVIIFHGLTRNKDVIFHKILAKSLADCGIASVRFDFNGHGESEGALKNMTIDNELEDARRIYTFTRTLPFVGTIGVVGHSQGGVVSILLGAELGEKNIKAMTLLAPGVGIHDSMVQGSFLGASFDPINVPNKIVLNNNIVLGKEYVLSGQRMKPFESAKKYEGKVLLIHGTADRLAAYSYSEHLTYFYKNHQIHILEGVDHIFSNHEKEVANEVAQFMKENLKAN
jgi:lysophospholipase-like protein